MTAHRRWQLAIALIVSYSLLTILYGAVTSFFLSFDSIDTITGSITYRTDYGPLIEAIPSSLGAAALAFLLYRRTRFGYWLTVAGTVAVSIVNIIGLIAFPPHRTIAEALRLAHPFDALTLAFILPSLYLTVSAVIIGLVVLTLANPATKQFVISSKIE